MKKINKACYLCNENKEMAEMNLIHDPDTGLGPNFICSSCFNKSVSEEIENTINSIDSTYQNDSTLKTDIICEAQVVDHVDEEDSDSLLGALASFGLKDKQEDLLYVKFKLVHANTNKNKDEFKNDELKKSEKTPILKLINWQHKEPSIGVIYKSTFVKAEDGTAEDNYIICYAAISKYRYKQYAEEIIKRHNENNLFFSMETYFKEAQCSICNEMFSGAEDSYCSHLKDRYSQGSATSRILRGLVFAGAGVVDNPADTMASSLAIAKSLENKENASEEEYLVENLNKEDLEKAIENAVSDLKKSNQDLITKITDLSLQMQETENQKSILASEKEDLSKKLMEITTAFEIFKTDIESEKKALERVNELITIGYKIPEKSSEAYTKFFNTMKTADDNSFELIKEMVEMNKSAASEQQISDENTSSASTSSESNTNIDIPTSERNTTEEKPIERVNRLLSSLIRN